MQLYIGNKNYSSWSLRAWLLMRHAGIEFEEVRMRIDFNADSDFKRAIAKVAPTGKVPVLVDNGFAVWDTLAIAEYLAEKFGPSHGDVMFWPADTRQRARARSLCAEMHAGFGALRHHCAMNIEAELHEVGARWLGQVPAVADDLARIVSMWQQQLGDSGRAFLFGRFGIADAYFAPVCMRIRGYGLPVPADIGAYVDRIFALPAMQQWVREARAEHEFLHEDEPYRHAPVKEP